MFQDGKENHKDALRSPAKIASKNFMAPTISAASKFTPSPRKKILGEKNELTRTSIQFLDKDSDLKSEAAAFNQTNKMNDCSHESTTVEQKENVVGPAVLEVNLNSANESTEKLSDVTENSDFFKNRPFCCSPVTSPIIAPLDLDPHLPPYDPKKNFLSPRPQFLRYKPNPRIEILLNKEGYDNYGEDDVTRLEDSFNLSENSSDTEEGEQEKEKEKEAEAEAGDSVHESSEVLIEKVSEEKHTDLGHESSEILSEMVLEEKQSDSQVKRTSEGRFFTRSKTFSFLFVVFLVACFSFSLTDSPPMDLPIYKDVGFSEIYHESLRFAGFAKESFDGFVENLQSWSMDFISYLSHQISQLFQTQKMSSIQFYNLTNSPIQEEFLFNSHIGTNYIQELEEEIREEAETVEEEEEDFEEMEVDGIEVTDKVDDIDVVTDEVVNEQPDEIQSSDDCVLEEKSNLEDVHMSKTEAIHEAEPEMEFNDLEMDANVADSNDESEVMSSDFSTESINTACLAGFSMVIMAVSAIFYMSKMKSNAKKPAMGVSDDNAHRESCSSETSSVQKGYKKKTANNKRESLASSSSDFSTDSPSYGSFTTFERIPIKRKDEVMLTPIRRSSRLLKNQVIS